MTLLCFILLPCNDFSLWACWNLVLADELFFSVSCCTSGFLVVTGWLSMIFSNCGFHLTIFSWYDGLFYIFIQRIIQSFQLFPLTAIANSYCYHYSVFHCDLQLYYVLIWKTQCLLPSPVLCLSSQLLGIYSVQVRFSNTILCLHDLPMILLNVIFSFRFPYFINPFFCLMYDQLQHCKHNIGKLSNHSFCPVEDIPSLVHGYQLDPFVSEIEEKIVF